MDKHHFQEKGKISEEYIATLCSNAFQKDFCFKNPFVDGRELCDVFVVLRSKVIIWQIKSLKEKEGMVKEGEIDKAIKQCLGAKRKLKQKTTIELVNVNGEKKSLILEM